MLIRAFYVGLLNTTKHQMYPSSDHPVLTHNQAPEVRVSLMLADLCLISVFDLAFMPANVISRCVCLNCGCSEVLRPSKDNVALDTRFPALWAEVPYNTKSTTNGS